MTSTPDEPPPPSSYDRLSGGEMFAHCREIWHRDDFSRCFEHDYLRTLIPLVICVLSLLHILFKLGQKARASRRIYLDDRLRSTEQSQNGVSSALERDSSIQHDNEDDSESVISTIDDDEIERNAQLALNPTVSQVDRTYVVQAADPGLGTTRLAVELLAVAGEVALHALSSPSVLLGVWIYVLVLAAARMVLLLKREWTFPTLWFHTTIIYGIQWIIYVLLFRSALIHSSSAYARDLMIGKFALVCVLVVVSMSSRIGNQALEIEYEDDIPPAREPLASVFSRATYSWVDPIVWTGYRHTLEISDVWNLVPRDKAAALLANYRQVKRTSSLAWHLVKYLKVELLQQAAWSCMSGFLTFVPTLLLKAILQYVEDPEHNSRSSAWFFVVLLFVSGSSSALSDNMALWIGRKVCIRLRAIIIGELYSKALKRKIGAGADKVLGQGSNKGNVKISWLQRLFRRHQSTLANQQNADEESEEDSQQVTSGAIINLMAVDSFKVADVCAYLHFLWATTPVEIVVAVFLLYQILGFSSIAGIGTMVVLLPVNLYLSKKFAEAQNKILAATDARINITNEVLSNIRIIKYFAWEQRFMDDVDVKRREELKNLRYRYILWSSAATIWGGVPIIITFFSFAIFTMVEKRELIPSIAFTALSLFSILRAPLDQLADMVAHVQESKVSVDRIEEFLNEENTQKYKQLRHPAVPPTELTIGFQEATLAWASKYMVEHDVESTFRMMDLDLKFKIGQLNIIVGPTGCGKTSLLLALLGEMTLLKGSVYLPGGRSREDAERDPRTGLTESIAYCAQQAWLANDTIKQNILFASPWNAKRYHAVLHACSLVKDLEILDSGDETLVGEKGVTLSGGQKQRISLARALYSSARHVLLDDVLSAVDSHTAKWIFEKAIMGPLMEDRTCLLVTHNVSLCLASADFAVVLDNGRITASGSAEEILRAGVLEEDVTGSTPVSRPASRHGDVKGNRERNGNNGTDAASVDGASEEQTTEPVYEVVDIPDKFETPLADPVKESKPHLAANAMHEEKAEGRIRLEIIVMYLRSMGGWLFWAVAAVIFAAQQVSNVSTNVWIRRWANAYAEKNYALLSNDVNAAANVTFHGLGGLGARLGSTSNTIRLPYLDVFDLSRFATSDSSSEPVRPQYYLGVFAILGIIYMAITFFREFILFMGSLAASKKIHLLLMERVSRAKFRFFDQTPLGQIMNRFSKDIENIDQEVAPTAVGVVHCLASIVTIVIVISVITPGFLIAGVFITIAYFLIGMFYINSSRDLKRLESVQRSPLYQHFGETLSGMTTIRAYGDERRFIRENLNRVNVHNRPFIYLWACNRWLAFRVDVTGALVSFFAGVFVMLSVGKIDAGAAGLSMTYAVMFTENVLWFVRLYASNEQNMNSVERIKEYLDVEQEAPAIISDQRPSGDWPDKGAIEFINYSTRYRSDFDLVLRNLSFKITPCQKVGVVGRTGAGKSSLALALFRALEAEEGQIIIDGVDIGLIGLQDLRESIVMVPQDPTLFSGTIRSNLDPFNLFSDEEIFTALRRVQLVGSTVTSGIATPSKNPASRPRTPANADAHRKTNGSLHKLQTSKAIKAKLNAVDQSPSPTSISPPPSISGAANRNPFLNLASTVAESGTNLSQGQRQLLCLARAMLKNPRVLLMDEATASIDYATDAKIQATIRELRDNTIIVIAHRLKTVIDMDVILVMDQGKVVEMGDPWTLIRPDGVSSGSGFATGSGSSAASASEHRWFRHMCEMSGELELLEREARRSWEAKRLINVDD